MERITLVEPRCFERSSVEVPEPASNEILIKMKYIGICGSDIHAYFGKHPFISCPVSLGHEFVGEVIGKGENVDHFELGDFVTSMPQIFCGHCEQCIEGRYNICDSLEVIGCQSDGAACEYFAFNAALAKKIPKDLDLKIATTIEPVAVGIHALSRGTSIVGKNVVVLGAGTIGNVTAQAARAKGAKRVMITDLSEQRLEIAKKCGVQFAINTSRIDLSTAINDCFEGEKADIFFECVGIGPTVNQAINLSKKGHDIVILGVFEKSAEVNMGLVQDKELRLIGSLMYTEKDYDETINFLRNGEINTNEIISKVFPFSEYEDAFVFATTNTATSMKILVELS